MTKTVSEELQLCTNKGVEEGERCEKLKPWQPSQREQQRRQEETTQTLRQKCGRAAAQTHLCPKPGTEGGPEDQTRPDWKLKRPKPHDPPVWTTQALLEPRWWYLVLKCITVKYPWTTLQQLFKQVAVIIQDRAARGFQGRSVVCH